MEQLKKGDLFHRFFFEIQVDGYFFFSFEVFALFDGFDYGSEVFAFLPRRKLRKA